MAQAEHKMSREFDKPDTCVCTGILKASFCSQQKTTLSHSGSLHEINKGKSELTHISKASLTARVTNRWTPSQRRPSETITPFVSGSMTCEKTVHWLNRDNNTLLHTRTHLYTTWRSEGRRREKSLQTHWPTQTDDYHQDGAAWIDAEQFAPGSGS